MSLDGFSPLPINHSRWTCMDGEPPIARVSAGGKTIRLNRVASHRFPRPYAELLINQDRSVLAIRPREKEDKNTRKLAAHNHALGAATVIRDLRLKHGSRFKLQWSEEDKAFFLNLKQGI